MVYMALAFYVQSGVGGCSSVDRSRQTDVRLIYHDFKVSVVYTSSFPNSVEGSSFFQFPNMRMMNMISIEAKKYPCCLN